jgi:hypothetical protein
LSDAIVTKSVKYTPPSDGIYALNCAGGFYLSVNGILFDADSNYNNYDANCFRAVVGIKGTTDDALYQSAREGNLSFTIPLANGSYDVTLKFAENRYTSAGSRVFNVSIGGTTVISNCDVYASAGANTAYDKVISATVTNGVLNIDFSAVTGKPMLSALLVRKKI